MEKIGQELTNLVVFIYLFLFLILLIYEFIFEIINEKILKNHIFLILTTYK